MQNGLSSGGNDRLDSLEFQEVDTLLKYLYASQYLAFT